MIIRNDREGWVGCNLCEDVVELSRKVRSNPETLMLLVEEFARDHRDCEQFKHDPRQAKLHRGFKVRMREEMAIAARSHRNPEETGPTGYGHDR